MKNQDKILHTFWGIGDGGFQMMVNVESVYFMFFLSDIAGFSPAIIAVISMVTSIVDFISAPASGMIINTTKALKWGRVRSWLLVAPPIVVAFFTLQFSAFGNDALSAVLIIVGYIISHFVWNIAYTANVASITVISKNNQERLLLNSHRIVWFNVGRLLNSYVVPLLINLLILKIAKQSIVYTSIAFGMSVVMMLGYFAHFQMFGKRVALDSAIVANERIKIIDALKVFKQNRHLLGIIYADMTSNISQNMIPALATYYFKYVAQNTDLLPVQLLLNSVAGLLGSYFIGKVTYNKQIQKKRICITVYMIICIVLVVARIFGFKVYVYMTCIALMQFFAGMTQPIEADMYMETAAWQKNKHGNDATSFIMGLMTVPSKLSVILRSAIISSVLLTINYVSDMAPTKELQLGFINASTLIPIVIALSGAIVLGLLYKINNEEK